MQGGDAGVVEEKADAVAEAQRPGAQRHLPPALTAAEDTAVRQRQGGNKLPRHFPDGKNLKWLK